MRIVSFGGITLPAMNGAQSLPVPFRSSVVPLRGGGFDQDGRKSYPESKIVTAQFWVTPTDGVVDTIIDNLYAIAAKGRQLLVVTMRDGSTQRQQWAKLVSATTAPKASVYAQTTSNVEGYETMQCQWEIVYPYWEATADFHILLDQGHALDDGLYLDAGNYQKSVHYVASTGLVTVNNAGNVANNNFQISINNDSGSNPTIEDIVITNETTGESLTWAGTLFLGDWLVIDCLEQVIRYNSLNTWNLTTLGTNQIGFFTLAVGNNEFDITYTGTEIALRFDWHKHYIR